MALIHIEGTPTIDAEQLLCAAYDIDGPLINAGLAERFHAIAATELGMRTHPERCGELFDARLAGTSALFKHIAEAKRVSHGNPELEYNAMVYDGFWEETFSAVHATVVKAHSQLQLNPFGALAVLEDLYVAKIQTAAWTSRYDAIARDPVVCPLGQRPDGGPKEHGFFDVFVTADTVTDAQGKQLLKPHSRGGEIILQALKIKNPKDVIYFGDRPSDMEAARNLGMVACGIVNLSQELNGRRLPAVQALIDKGASYLADSVADTRGLLGLPILSPEETERREIKLNESRQFYYPTLADERAIGLRPTSKEHENRMAALGAHVRRHIERLQKKD